MKSFITLIVVIASLSVASATCTTLVLSTGYDATCTSGQDCTITCATAMNYSGTPNVKSVTCSSEKWSTLPTSGCTKDFGNCSALALNAWDYTMSCSDGKCMIGCTGTGTPNVKYTNCTDSTKKWSTMPTSGCGLACAVPTVPTGYQLTDCTNGHYSGSGCKVSCATGYSGKVVGDQTYNCSKEGDWSTRTWTGCSASPCANLTLATGYEYSCPSGWVSGSKCSITCKTGYNGEPAIQTVNCTKGVWTTKPTSGCVAATNCGALSESLMTGYSTVCTKDAFGDSCTVTCASGYLGTPDVTTVECSSSTHVWGTTPTSGCVSKNLNCHQPSATGYTFTCAKGTNYTDTCAVACNSEYTGTPHATNSTNTMCMSTGFWSPLASSYTGCTRK